MISWYVASQAINYKALFQDLTYFQQNSLINRQDNINQSINIKILEQDARMTSSIRIFQKFNPNIQRGRLKACEICSAKFNVFTPEHQCKRCLRAVCSSCAGNKRQVYKQGMSKAPHRLCKFCNTQSSILIQFVSTNKLKFGKDSQIGRRWHKLIPKSSAQSSSFKQYKKFSIDTFNQLWDSYNFSLREFIGLLTFNMQQGSVYMQINNVYTQLQSRGVSEKFQNVILMIVFVLCFSGADVCTDLVEFLCSLKKTVVDQKQILQSYLNTLLIAQQQSRKITDYINYKYKQFIGPLSVNAVTAQCTIHVISKAFEKQRIDEVFMLLAIVIQINFDMLVKNKGNKVDSDYQMLRDCDMSIYMGKFKTLGTVDVTKSKLTLKQALSAQKQQNQQNNQTRIIQKPTRKQSNHSEQSTPPKPSYFGRANRQTIQQDIVNDQKFNVPASHDSMSQSFVSEGESKRENPLRNNQSFDQGMTKSLKFLNNNNKKLSHLENQSPSSTNILGSINSQQDVERTKSSYITLSHFNEDQISLANSRNSLASQPIKQTPKQAKKQVVDLNLSKIMKQLGKKKSKNTSNATQEISITELLKNEQQKQKQKLNNVKTITETTTNSSPNMKKQAQSVQIIQQSQPVQQEVQKTIVQKQPPKIIYNDNVQLNNKNSPENIEKSALVVQNRGRAPTVNQNEVKVEPQTRKRTTTVSPSQNQVKLQAELKELQKKLQKRQEQGLKLGEMLRLSQGQIDSLKQQLNQVKNQYQLLSHEKRQIQNQLSLQKAQKATNTKKQNQQLHNQFKSQIQQQNQQLNKLRQQLQQASQKNNLLIKQQQKFQLQSASMNKQMEELKISNRLMKDKLQQNLLGLGNRNSKRDQNIQQLNKINQLMQKNIENKNKQIQSLTKKNKQLSLQLEQFTRANRNSQFHAQIQAEAEQQHQLAKKLKKQNQMLIKKMQQLGQRVVKQQGQKLQISSQLFQLKQRQRSQSMILQETNGIRASTSDLPQRATVSMEANPQGKGNCIIF